jgi:3',5'-cyclic-AMP phosphodiesterase
MKSRRHFLQRSVAGLGTLVLPMGLFAKSDFGQKSPARAIRIAHITDVHILDQKNAENCFARVLQEINSMADKPDLIINTGDTVMDENKQTKETVTTRWKAWNSIVSSENKIPLYSALGNHDVWYGPDGKLDAEYKKEKRYGKQWAMEMLSLSGNYYTFEKNGWQFIALDSINGSPGYQLDDVQFEWLKGELSKTPANRPVCIYSHVPILSMGAMLYATMRSPISEVKFPVGDMHSDHQRIKNLFIQYPQVKLCLSGHVHYIDEVDYLGVKYLCNGAVSGNWWRSPLALDEFPPVYSIIDLFTDGTVENNLVFYNYQF